MKRWEQCRVIGMGLMGFVMVGLAVPSPIAWAQMDAVIAERDPLLASTIEAATRADPDLQKDPELRAAVEQLTKDCLTDPRSRAEIAHEVTQVRAEGGVEKVMSKEVLAAVRSETSTSFAAHEADMRKALEALPANSSERRMAELSMERGKRVMEAYAKGEVSPPPPREMVAHAQEMFKEWSETSGASQRDIEMAKYAFEQFARGGEIAMGPGYGGGPGGFGGPGPGREMGPPSDQQLKDMLAAGKITPEQLAKMGEAKAAWDAAANDPTIREKLMGQYGHGFEGPGPGQMPKDFMFDPSGHGGPGPWEGPVGGGPVQWEDAGGGFPKDMPEFGGAPPTEQQIKEYIQRDIQQQVREIQQQQTQDRYETVMHRHQDNTDHAHNIHVHADGVRHDHTATSPADTAPSAVFTP